jgi:alginate O-acetyltransferase complex protein AlgI
MLFPTGQFLLLFLPVALGVFFICARLLGRQAAALWLTLASLFFYGYWRPLHVPLLVVSVAGNYWAGGLILAARQRGDAARSRQLLMGAVALNLLVLALFKYGNFFIGTAGSIIGTHLPMLAIALPLGISFFTFTQIAYLADVQAGKAVERSPLRYALFVTYFPHLVAGPVLHHSQMMPQFGDPEIYTPRLRNLASGMAFLVAGLAKKVLIADSLAPLANVVFAAAGSASVSADEAWRGVLAYTLQIYFDFSGYSDMAVGLSLLFNVRLPFNFNSPYQARNIIDFWRRWHMSLSAFLRDYLYIALGGNRYGSTRRYANLLITMLLGGLWHGASWTFVVWGGLHGLYLAINHAWRWCVGRLRLPAPGALLQAAASMAGSILTLIAVVGAWVFFRATDFGSAWRLLRAMAGLTGRANSSGVLDGSTGAQWLWIAALLLWARFMPNTQETIDGALAHWYERLRPELSTDARALLLGGSLVLAFLLVVISASRSVTEFIYFNF